jgi:hypothetical protein
MRPFGDHDGVQTVLICLDLSLTYRYVHNHCADRPFWSVCVPYFTYWGSRGRWFKSTRPDFVNIPIHINLRLTGLLILDLDHGCEMVAAVFEPSWPVEKLTNRSLGA